jgi:hypothetical protein
MDPIKQQADIAVQDMNDTVARLNGEYAAYAVSFSVLSQANTVSLHARTHIASFRFHRNPKKASSANSKAHFNGKRIFFQSPSNRSWE